ncbi:hypothetical protein K8R33_02715 [archaeon]|nr:hypothetical protein [archaeon]
MAETKSTLRTQLKEKDISPEKRRDLRKELVELIKEKGAVRLIDSKPLKYQLTYDTFGQTLEPVYFWVLDFMRNSEPSGMGFEVNKVEEEFEASVGGGFFGEVGTKASVMQDRAMKILETVNAVLRTLINLIYDLREYDMRLEIYDDADPKKQSNADQREAAEYSLKGIWMDQVDIKAGLGSVNQLSRGDLQFVTLRDALFQARTIKQAKRLDLNKRVKTILMKKLEEYSKWRVSSEIELRKRYAIERNYLKSQVDSLRLYTKWARPYLRAAQKLGMKEFLTPAGLPSPDIVATFNNMQMELKLFAKKEISPASAFDSYKKINFDKKIYACLEIEFKFRTAPQVARSGQSTHYAHLGIIDIFFNAYGLAEDDIKDIEQLEVYEDMDLVEQLTDVSLKDMQADIDHYLEEYGKKDGKKEKKTQTIPNPIKGLQELFPSIKMAKLPISPFGKKQATKYQIDQVTKVAKSKALTSFNTMYDVFKKSHGMLSW